MDRIDNVDLREALRDIARNNTFFHLDNDINISFRQMEWAAKVDDPTETTLIWVSYPGGIDCYSERDAFQKDTRAYNGIMYHGFDAQSDRKLVYAVEVAALIDDIKLCGSLYEIDIHKYAANVRQNAVVSDTVRLYLDKYINGFVQEVMPKAEFNELYPRGLPKMNHYRPEPRDPAALQSRLDSAYKDRAASCTPCSLYKHTSDLYDKRSAFYAAQILRDLDKVPEPNYPGGYNFSVPLNSYIANAFGPEQLRKVLDALPFKTASITMQKGQGDFQVVTPSSEVMKLRRDQAQQNGSRQPAVTPPKPSILGQLADAVKEAAAGQPAKAPQKQKGAEIHV